MRVPVRKKGKLSGFTLVEMAIVLVIIGIILAGVMKGRDIVRGAQVKQFSQQFAQKWGTIAQTYYDKTGQVLNDGSANGGSSGTAPDGKMDGDVSANTVLDTLTGVGITPCTMVKSKLVSPVGSIYKVTTGTTVCKDGTNDVMNPWQTLVEGEYTGSKTVEVDLQNLALYVNGVTSNRNVVVLYNVPTDAAVGLDTAIDGINSGTSGSCLNLGTTTSASTTPAAWDAATSGYTNTVGIVLDF